MAVALAIAVCGLWPVAAQAAPGDLDPSFGTGGTVTGDFGSPDAFARDVALDASGRLVVVGQVGSGFAVARYAQDGSLDLTFGGGDGLATASFGAGADDAAAVAIDGSGRIVVAGSADAADATCGDCDFGVARFTEAGDLDPTFGGGDGEVTTGFGAGTDDNGVDLAIDGSGQIVVGGTSVAADESTTNFALARYTPAGELDATFDADGTLLSGFAGVGFALDVDGSDRIVFTGTAEEDFLTARYLEDGSLDPAFGSEGTVTTDVAPGEVDFPADLSVDASGSILVAGTAAPSSFAVLRYSSAGALDPAFDSDGIALAEMEGGGEASGMAIDGNDRIVVVGSVFPAGSEFSEFAVLRFEADGSLDTGFGDSGMVTSSFGPERFDGAAAAAVDGGGRIVAVGSSGGELDSDFALARYLGEDAPEPPAEETTDPDPSPASSPPPPIVSLPPPAPAPRAGIAFAAGMAHVKGGRAFTRLRCHGQAACRGVAKLVARVRVRRSARRSARRAKNVVLGRSRFWVPAGRTKVLRIRLNRKGRLLLHRAGRRGMRARLVGRGLRNRMVQLKARKGKRRRSRTQASFSARQPLVGPRPSAVAGDAVLRIRRAFTRNHCDKLRGARARRCKAAEVILVTYRFRAFIPVSAFFELLLVPGTPNDSGFPPLFVRRLERTTPAGDQTLRFMFGARDLERRCRKAQEKCYFSGAAILGAADPGKSVGGRDAERATLQIVPSPAARKRALAKCRKLDGRAKRRCVRRVRQP